MASFPKDRFDELPKDLERVGAHRGPKRRGRGWIAFAWALLATGVLMFAGLFGVSRFLGIDVGIPLFEAPASPTPTPTPTPTMEPVTDPSTIDPAVVKITILNATGTAGVQNTVGDQLAASGWPVTSRINAAEPIQNTFIYFSDPANEGIARGIAVALGLGEVRLVPADTFPGQPIVVSLGTDYVSPPEPTEPPAEG